MCHAESPSASTASGCSCGWLRCVGWGEPSEFASLKMLQRRAVFVAMGSRGDVQPLVVLASALVHSWEVVFVTHAELEGTLRAGDEGALLHPRVALRTLALSCFLKLDDKTSSLPDVLDEGGRRRAEWLKAVEQSFGADVLLCNLFAMPPVHHLSERLGIPWVCGSPCLVPYAAPAGFEASFLSSFPELASVLRARDEGLGSGTAGFSWADVKAWLWPLFTENHSLLREELLGCHRCRDTENAMLASTTSLPATTWLRRC